MSKEYIEREALIKSIVNTPSVACQSAWETGTHRYTEVLNRLAELQHEVIDMITSAPKADVVEVVRCKDCKHKVNFQNRIMCDINARCSSDGSEWYGLTATNNNNFCSYGERKDGADNEI